MKKLTLSICILFFAIGAWGQSKAKFNPKIGFSAYRFADENEILKGKSHATQFLGFDLVVQEKKGVFMPGFHYARMALQAEDFKLGELFEPRENLHFVRIPLSFGRVFAAGKFLEIIPYGGANATFFIKVDKNNAGQRLDLYNSVQAGMQIGIQAKVLNHITFDLVYAHSILQRIKTRTDSKTRGLIVSAGFSF